MSPQLFTDVRTGTVRVSAPPLRGVTSASSVAQEAAALHQDARLLVEDTAALRRRGSMRALEVDAQSVLRSEGTAILAELRGRGFSWRDVARILGVSVPALQKWRRGEGIAPANRLKLAMLAALTRTLADEHMIVDPVSWLDTPVRTGVHLAKIDLLARDRFDLVLELAHDGRDGGVADVFLDEVDPEWRTSLVDASFEVFQADDGVASIRPRG